MKVHCLIFDGFSDWEPSFVLPELRNNKVEVVSVGFSNNEVTSMGGFKIKPEKELFSLDLTSVKTLIIPGGVLWENEISEDLLILVKKLHALGSCLAAICSGTLVLAKAGLLELCRHTSNDLSYLKSMVSSYEGESLYVSSELAVCDKKVVTASGLGAIEFAKTLLLHLEVLDKAQPSKWFDLFKYAKY